MVPATGAAIVAELAGLPLDVTRHRSNGGLVAVLEGGSEGPTTILRGDMDALPVHESTGLDFASTNGAMHACGHDLHTAMLVGAARLLVERRSQLEGKVVFMFQPGEEGDHGARWMIDEGLLNATTPSPTRGLAIHVLTMLPSGVIATRPGPIMASADQIHVKVHGRGGHASMPHLALDPVPVAAEIVTALQTAVTRQVSVFDPTVITFGQMWAGSAHNVIPDTAYLEGTVRALSEPTRSQVHELIRRVVEGIVAAHGAHAQVEIELGYPVTVNDAATAHEVLALAEELVGSDRVVELSAPIMGAEDWSYVLQRVPGAMAFLGACPPGVDPSQAPANHSNLVEFDEASMTAGMALYAAFALAR
jgi:hippurate hydrolase